MSARAAWSKVVGISAEPVAKKKPKRKSTALRAIARANTPAISAKERYARYLTDIKALAEHDAAIPERQHFAVEAVAKPRMSQRDTWEKRPAVMRYRAYCDELRLRGARLPYAYRVDFVLSMPESWPEELKVQMDGMPHLLKPDTSNLCKAIEDALVPSDEVIHNISATKRWGRDHGITISKATNYQQPESDLVLQ